MSKEYFLVQKVVVNEHEVYIDHIQDVSYIECASMDGNKLIMNLVDHVSIYRDTFGIKKDAILDVTLADTLNQGEQVFIEKFVVIKATVNDGILQVEAFQKDAYDLKQPVVEPRFFTNMQPKQILAELLPHLRIVSDSYELGTTYHLNAGGTKSRLIRTMARDYGSVVFICRGVVYFKALKNIPMVEQFRLEHGNEAASEHSIARFSIIGEQSLFERVLNKNYASWDTVDGFQGGQRDGAMVMVSVPQAKALNNQHMAIIPLLDIELNGDTRFMPTSVCTVMLHKQLPENELDESLPQMQLINRVTHYQRRDRYQCRIELGERNL